MVDRTVRVEEGHVQLWCVFVAVWLAQGLMVGSGVLESME